MLLCRGGRPAPRALRGQVWFSNLKLGLAWGCWTGPSRLPTMQASSPEILLPLDPFSSSSLIFKLMNQKAPYTNFKKAPYTDFKNS